MEAQVEELTGGVELVAGFGVFELALHDVDEEADYDAAVFGLLADDFGEGLGFLIFLLREHWFYDREVHSGVSRGWWQGFLFTTESAEIFGAGGYPLLEKLRKTFLLGLGADVARGFLASVVVVVYDSEIPTLGMQPGYASGGVCRS